MNTKSWKKRLIDSIIDTEQLAEYIELSLKEKTQTGKIIKRLPMRITPYYSY